MYELIFHEKIEEDLEKLPDEVYDEAFLVLKKLKKDYFKFSLPLENKDGRDLSNCRKTYFFDAKYRIVSQFLDNKINIVNIIVIGKRNNYEVYNIANNRLS